MASFKGKKNCYICQRCASTIITIDRDEGVTPFMLACAYSGKKCSGMMQSQMYIINQELRASHEWVRPSQGDLRRWRRERNKGMLAHARAGGLIIKPWARKVPQGAGPAFGKFFKQAVEADNARVEELRRQEQAQRAAEVVEAVGPVRDGLPGGEAIGRGDLERGVDGGGHGEASSSGPA